MLEEPTTFFDPFAGPEIAHVLHVTDSQEELWHSCLFGGEDANRAYNESLSLILKGNLDITALDEAVQRGRLKKGDIVVFSAFGAGFTWGASVVKW